MNRLNLIYKMDDLLEECKTCERPYDHHAVRCVGCSIYTQLREIGEQLEGKQVARKGIDMTVEEFVQLHYVEGKNYEQIGELKGVDKTAVSNWKYNRREEVEKVRNSSPQAHSEAKEVSESARKVETDTDELQALKAELESKDEQIKGLQEKLIDKNNKLLEYQASLNEADTHIDKVARSLEEQVEYWKNLSEHLEAELKPIRQLAYLKLKQDLA